MSLLRSGNGSREWAQAERGIASSALLAVVAASALLAVLALHAQRLLVAPGSAVGEAVTSSATDVTVGAAGADAVLPPNLFGTLPQAVAPLPARAAPRRPYSELGLALKGVVAGAQADASGRAIFAVASAATERSYRPGEEITAGVVLRAVRPRGVTLEYDGGAADVELPGVEPGAPSGPVDSAGAGLPTGNPAAMSTAGVAALPDAAVPNLPAKLLSPAQKAQRQDQVRKKINELQRLYEQKTRSGAGTRPPGSS